MKKKLISLFSVCFILCSLFATPVSAAEFMPTSETTQVSAIAPYATNYFSGGTGTMNTMAGSQSKIFNVSSGSVPKEAVVTDVTLNVTVSRGSIPFYIVVKDPAGHSAEKYIRSSGRITFTEFNGKDPKGTWQIYIYNTGAGFQDVSTATARMTVNYQY